MRGMRLNQRRQPVNVEARLHSPRFVEVHACIHVAGTWLRVEALTLFHDDHALPLPSDRVYEVGA